MRHRDGNEEDTEALSLVDGARSSRVRLGLGAGIVLLIVALVAAVVINAFAQRGSSTEVSAEPTSSASSAAAAGSAGSVGGVAAEASTLVHVLGAVKRPGLVSLSADARVVDAVAAAGGLTDDAELSGINLARPVTDGEQLVVARVGEVVPPQNSSGAEAPGAGSGGSNGTVNLNTATQADLETLPRIGPALAGRIVDWRTANGRFSTIADLMKVTGIGQKVYDGLKDRITV
jgi:competence protein ComEA